MNMVIDVTTVTPDELLPDELMSFSEMVKQCDEVAPDFVETNVRNAKALVRAWAEGKLVGVAALKRPQASYRECIGRKAGVAINEDSYPYELGYVCLLPEAQGNKFSHRLVAVAIERAEEGAGIFATTRTDNYPMLATLGNADFKPVGKKYQGRDDTQMIQLLVRG